MDIGSVATMQVLTVGPRHSLFEVARMMYERRSGSAVVQGEGENPGIITERDLLRAVAEGADLSSAPVEDYMTANAITASASWDAEKAARLMLEHGFRHLVVIDDGGRVEGILSIRDLVKALLD
ncbi:CBS domain-containing protein [soil metagenome]